MKRGRRESKRSWVRGEGVREGGVGGEGEER